MKSIKLLYRGKKMILGLILLCGFLLTATALAGPNDPSDPLPPAQGGDPLPEITTGEKPLPPRFRGPDEPKWNNDECDQNSFRVAFVVVTRKGYPTNLEKNAIEKARLGLPTYFSYATKGLAQITTQDSVFFIPLTQDMINPNDPNGIYLGTIAKKFYETHDDVYDFIVIVPSFEDTVPSFYWELKDIISGIGREDEVDFPGYTNGFEDFEQLKGIVRVPIANLDRPNLAGIETLLHEIGHHWNTYFHEELRDALQIEMHLQHHHQLGIQGMPGERDASGAFYRWEQDITGSYSVVPFDYENTYARYHPFNLYTMGLLPESEYDDDFLVFDNPLGQQPRVEDVSIWGTINVNQIKDILGPRQCIKIAEWGG